MNNPRQIDLPSSPLPLQPEIEVVEQIPVRRTFSEDENEFGGERREAVIIREGNRMVYRKTEEVWIPIEIAYAWLKEQVEIGEDPHTTGPPWEEHDGNEHYLVAAAYEQETGYDYISTGDHRDERVVLARNHEQEFREYAAYLRDKGASKQVAAEAIAAIRRKRVEQIVDWYENGWKWYRVSLCVDLLGKKYRDSNGGIDDLEYAESDCVEEVVSEVIAELEADGYVVTGQPEYAIITSAESARRNRIWQIKENAKLF